MRENDRSACQTELRKMLLEDARSSCPPVSGEQSLTDTLCDVIGIGYLRTVSICDIKHVEDVVNIGGDLSDMNFEIEGKKRVRDGEEKSHTVWAGNIDDCVLRRTLVIN